VLWAFGLRGVDRTVRLVLWPDIWQRGRLGACALRSSTRASDVKCMGCGQSGIHSGAREVLWSYYTTVAGGCVGI